VATIQTLNPTDVIKETFGKINTSLTNLNNDKLEKSGDTMTGLLTTLGGIDLEVSSVPTGKVGRMHANGATNQIYYHDGTDWRNMWHHGNNPASVSANGYQKLASGMILQWGTTTEIAPNILAEIVYPIVFPNTCFALAATVESDWDDVAAAVVSYVSRDLSGVTHNASASKKIKWIAIGW